MPFVRDPSHWLLRFSPREWVRAATAELAQAENAYAKHQPKAGLAGAKRAAGMALNANVILEPRDGWGRTYVEHLSALVKDETAPTAAREAAALLAGAPLPGGAIVTLRAPSTDERVLEAARTVMAHAYAIALRHEDA